MAGVWRGGGGYAKLLLPPGHGGEVDGLHVVAVVPEEAVRCGAAEGRVSHVERQDMGGRVLHREASSLQGSAQVTHVPLVTGTKRATLLATENLEESNEVNLPSTDGFLTLMLAMAPLRTVGGRLVVKMNPAP